MIAWMDGWMDGNKIIKSNRRGEEGKEDTITTFHDVKNKKIILNN